MKIVFLFLIKLLLLINVYSQKNSLLLRAEAYYSNKEYFLAIPDYEKHYSLNNWDAMVLHWADAYVRTGNLDEGINVYSKYVGKYSVSDSVLIVYADLLKQSNQYEEAKETYLKAKGEKFSSEQFLRFASYCDSARIELNKKSNILVKNIDNINSAFSDIAPVKYFNNIVFSSNREGAIIERKTREQNLPLFDLYISKEIDSVSFEKPGFFSPEINSVHHECCATFTGDFKKIFFTKSFDRPYSDSPGKKNSLKMYSAIWHDNKWDSLHTFIFNDTTRSYAHPSIEMNEEMFFFASDMEGGYGGTDIYVCFNLDGKWTNPVNLGPHVNTSFNEMYPFYHSDGTLYFSSNRPEGMGGYDIYYALENEDGEYAFIKNAGWPVSSPGNDISISWNETKGVGYFSSDRKGGKGREDLYIILNSKF